jgi:alkylhydroperoxidase family enzyme
MFAALDHARAFERKATLARSGLAARARIRGAQPDTTGRIPKMARLPYVDLEQTTEEVRTLLERLAPLRIYRMVAHAESAFRPFLRLGNAILAKQELSPRLRELAILRIASLSGANYEWVQHVAIARGAGVREEQIEALERREVEGSEFSDDERAVLRFTTELVSGARASDETFGELGERFTHREIVELILAIGYYMMVARLLETTGVDLDPPATGEFVRSLRP